MKILWLINVPLPEASKLLEEEPSPYGGWLINAAEDLSNEEEVELTVVFPKSNVKKSGKLLGDKITYYYFQHIKKNDEKVIDNNKRFEEIVDDVRPDLVHVFGTEFAHSLSMINTCNKMGIKAVVSIQGLVSVISKHMTANLPIKVIYGKTIRNIINRDHVMGLKKSFYLRGKNEVKALEKSNYVIGRTTWDKACISQINDKAEYYFCNETLRKEFYRHEWDLSKIEKNTIFLSQASYSIKGLHYVLEAMPLILKKFPDTKVYVSGKDITQSKSIKDKFLLTYYAKYIKKLIKDYQLEKHIIFTSPLDEEAMCDRYLKSHVFVCPSSIENSPNSLAEAMILGVPSVATNVGGISDMLKHEEEGFIYQADAPYMLAHYICEIFDNETLALKFSKNAKIRAENVHNRSKNTIRLLEIYEEILQKKE